MKKVAILVAAILMSISFISCDDESNSEKGEKAAVEFCNCLDAGNTMDECEDALKDKYSKAEYTNSDFVNAFNEVAEPSCDVTMTVFSN